MVFTAQQIAAYTGGTVEGDPNATIGTFAKIEEGVEGALSFLANPQYEEYIYETKSSVVLVNKDFQPAREVKATLVRVDNAYESVAKLLQLYQSMQQKRVGIDSLAFIDKTAKIGKDCYIGPFVAIGENVEIGDGVVIHPHATIGPNSKVGNNTEIYSNAVIYHGCIVGSNCILHAGCVIGADGFGFAPTPNGYDKIPQIGIVTIEDNVEIGANTSAQVGVAGSSKVGEWCVFAGQVGIAGHLKVGDRTTMGAQAGLAGGNLAKKGGATLMGYPAIEHKKFAKNMAALNSLPELLKEVAALKKEIEEIKNNK